MKKLIELSLLLSIFLMTSAGCSNGGKADRDGNKSIEGHSDPANTGGKLGGSGIKNIIKKDTTKKSY